MTILSGVWICTCAAEPNRKARTENKESCETGQNREERADQ